MILFGPKRPNLRIWSWNFRKQISDLKSAFSKYGTSKIWLRLENWYLLAQDTRIWAYGLKIWKMKAIRKFQISSILKIWIVLGRFIIFGGSFRFVSGRFGSLRVLVSTFLNMGSNGITSCDFCLPATDIFECLNVILTSFFEFFYQVN